MTRSLREKLRRRLRYSLLRLKRLRGEPRVLAGGIAIGVFVGLSPTIPFHTPLVILLAVLTGSSILAAILVSWLVFNPLTIVPIYGCSVWLGNAITPYHTDLPAVMRILERYSAGAGLYATLEETLALGAETAVVLVAGGFLFSFPFALLAYYQASRYFSKRAAGERPKQIQED